MVLAGSATAEDDYGMPTPSTLVLNATVSSGMITIPIIEDSTPEPTKNFTVTLELGMSNVSVEVAPNSTQVLLQDNGEERIIRKCLHSLSLLA